MTPPTDRAAEAIVDRTLDAFVALTKITTRMRAELRDLILRGRYVTAKRRWRDYSIDRAANTTDAGDAYALWIAVSDIVWERSPRLKGEKP